MGEASTDTLRELAPSWTLAGDDTLLTILQNTHQKIVSKCREVNAKLEDMVSSLDDASIHIQNVNNKFMSLSNRQFIESRVYDDDADLSTDLQTNKESPQPSLPDELSILKNSLAILDNAHEITEILDDSDSDSDNEISVVLKPKDMYSSRPLPYIIGTQQWRSKWHAGLIIENSDSESIQSKGNSDVEYSDSDIDELQTDRQIDNTISESSSLQSDRVPESNPLPAAQVAAQIASIMAATQPIIERPVTPPSPKEYINRKPPAVYKPQQPVTSTVFFDEPPPLDQYDSEGSQDDIFAEINKNKPYNNTIHSAVDDLFGFNSNDHYVKGDRGGNPVDDLFGVPHDDSKSEPLSPKPISTLNQHQLSSQSHEIPTSLPQQSEENVSKKPIGAISLFGSNHNTDTIGAAILKRNLRRSSTSDESGSDVPVNRDNIKHNRDEIDNKDVKKDIINDLFSKKDTKTQEDKKISEVKNKEYKDLFSDNLFDDVDDIFTTNVKVTSKTAQPLFDDEDDLFSDIAKPKLIKPSTSKESKAKIVEKLFDSDDDLFSDIQSTKLTKSTSIDLTKKEDTNVKSPNIDTETESTKIDIKTKEEVTTVKESNLFDGTSKTDEARNVKSTKINTSENEKVNNKSTKTDQTTVTNKITEKLIQKSIFDSDSDDDIFNFGKPTTVHSSIRNDTAKSLIGFQSPSLFDDDEVDDLFRNTQNDKKYIKENEQSNIDFVSTSIETKSPPNIDKDIIDHNKVVIEKEAFTQSEEISNSLETSIKQNTLDVDIQKSNIAVDKSSLNIREPIPKSVENPLQSKTIQNETLFPDIHILNKALDKKFEESENISSTKNNEVTQPNLFGDEISDSTKVLIKPQVHITNSNESSNRIKEDIFSETIDNTPSKVDEKDKTVHVSQIEQGTDNNSATEYPKNEKTLDDSTINAVPPQIPLFDDIEPPAFEKIKEPKKSKNVNALFDDDSEDETFFKKNDVISDVKPDIFSNKTDFGLFIDEPPAIDEFDSDFSDVTSKELIAAKNNEDSKITDNNKASKDYKPNDSVKESNVPKDLFNTSIDYVEQPKVLEKESPKTHNNEIKTRNLFDDLDDNLFTTNVINKETPKKEIGKINSNLNINVQALIPGASPKKVKSEQNAEPILVKSVSFEDTIDTDVLDNKVSKERAKIQVKRRPSSRRARHEAVRKSIIDTEKDSFNIDNVEETNCIEESTVKTEHTIDETDSNKSKEILDIDKTTIIIERADHKQESSILNITNQPIDKENSDESKTKVNTKTDLNYKDNEFKNDKVPEKSTKIVYVLNDEDIFQTDKHFGETSTTEIAETKTDKDTKKEETKINKTTKISLFDSDEEEDDKSLFKTKPIVKKTKLFDSDSDDDLFSGTKTKNLKTNDKAIKKSLFDDEDEDGDELFGAKTKVKLDKKSISSTSKESSKKPVFADPLTLFGED